LLPRRLGIGHQNDVAAAGRHFLHVGDGLLEHPVERRDHTTGMFSSISAIGRA